MTLRIVLEGLNGKMLYEFGIYVDRVPMIGETVLYTALGGKVMQGRVTGVYTILPDQIPPGPASLGMPNKVPIVTLVVSAHHENVVANEPVSQD